MLNLAPWLLALFLLPQDEEKGKKQEKDITEMTLEELMNLEVTSVSKKEEKLQHAASAVYVIRQEDLRRTGTTSIAEALRMVPGVQVAQLDANKWAITSRGFNGRFANKLLVLIDGRSVYTPLFSGVYWDVQDTMLQDIDRIEVIRGPGGTLWGANAVNGVINIITKNSKDTQGALLHGGVGSEEKHFAAGRYGGQVGPDFSYRVFAKYFDRDDQFEGHDDWFMSRAGIRADWKATAKDSLTLQADYYHGFARDLLTVPILSATAPFSKTFGSRSNVSGGDVLLRWEHQFEEKSQFSFQFYYDRTNRKTEIPHEEKRDTFDVDFQHRFPLLGWQDIVWGLGYRRTSDSIDGSFTLSFDPGERSDNLFSAFLQDEIALVADQLFLTLGSKFEYNDYTHFEVQPSARVSWTPHSRHSAWASVSRAVRTPSRAEDDVRISQKVLPGPVVGTVFGDRNYDAETLLAFELGYRMQPVDELSFDLAFFYNEYDDLRTLELGAAFAEASPSPAHFVAPNTASNRMQGQTVGVEVSCNFQVLEWWRLQASYSHLRMFLTRDLDSADSRAENPEGEAPRHQAYFRSSMNLPWNFELDWVVRYVDALLGVNIGSYVETDLRLGWRHGESLEIALVGRNLLDPHHPEFTQIFIDTQPTEVERSVYLSATVRF